ncbi:proteoglycan 4 isoform X2 [Drosophila novamexicana]|uniref:proteoglycan 4 isoform X2 n=1 Tax=Drosophila novamexicana TaxID=47314 RepID=UPI0011E5D71C|nr:proteoglycan 4 isoform X2 [Drosophila novamexicana]
MTEMHSHGNDNNVKKEQEQEREREREHGGIHVDSLYLPDLPDRPCSAMSEQSEIKLVEEEIAAVLSGESEVLKEHNVLGIFPKPGVCMTSDVLRSLNEEVTKTKLEKEKENRKWSTFLQRPDRPVPKSKQQLEAERHKANAYKVKIVKSAPRDKSPMPEAPPAPKEATPPPQEEAQVEPVEQPVEQPDEEPLPTDSEVPNLEQLPDNGNTSNNNNNNKEDAPEETEGEQLEKTDTSKEVSEERAEREAESEAGKEPEAAKQTAPAEPNELQPEADAATPPKTDEELALEKQLADVQKQLAALSTLPSTIQSTLDAVTKQLAELLPTFKLQQQEQNQQQQQQIDGQQAELSTAEEDEYEALSNSAAGREQLQPEGTTAPENNEDKCDANDLEVAEISLSNGDNRQLEEQLSEELCFKKQKHNVRFQV